MKEPESLFPFLVQRRLSGVQGENGCWCDEGIVKAESADDAMQKWADACITDADKTLFDVPYRVALAPEWERFLPHIKRTVTERAVVGRA